MPRTELNRRLRRLRRALAFLAAVTALLVAVACRLESTGRAVAAIAALGCLIAWLVVLETEGRVADRLERRGQRRRTLPRHAACPRLEARGPARLNAPIAA